MINPMVKPGRLTTVVVRQLRLLREQHAVRQDDVARAARRRGLKWTRATVAALETGRRKLGAEELVLLPAVLSDSFGRDLQLADLLPLDALIALPGTTIRGDAFRQLLQGQATIPPQPGTPESDQVQAVVRRREFRRRRALCERIWPTAQASEVATAERDAGADAEQKAAHDLGVDPFAIALAARKLWGRSLSDERDRRAADRGSLPPRRLQARRGHMTRKLLTELRVELQAIATGRAGGEIRSR